MWFGEAPIKACEGAILAHSRSAGGRRLKKGRLLSASDIADLAASGLTHLTVARLEPGDVPEDAAAARIAKALEGPGIRRQDAFTGRANLYAEAHGVFCLDRHALDEINAIDEGLTVATLPPFARVRSGQMTATVKVIPFALAADTLRAAEALADAKPPLLSVAAFRPSKAGLVLTRFSETKQSVLAKSEAAVTARLQALGLRLEAVETVAHEPAAVAAALARLQAAGCRLHLIFGASAIVDRRDVIPAGIQAAGGTVLHVGMPVDPGNLLALGRLGEADILGLPGCARSPKVNGADWVLERLAAHIPIGPEDIAHMGAGGLLKEIPTRPQPRRGAADRDGTTRSAAILLAAGLSRRMGGVNKLLADLAGKPLIRHAAQAALASKVERVIVVVGHRANEVRAALDGLDVDFVDNPDFAAGLSTSLHAGIAALGGRCDDAVICLGDMPGVKPGTIDRLLAALDAEEGRLAAVPVYQGKRGNPVAWHRRYFPQLQALEGDRGARPLLDRIEEEVADVAVDDPGVLFDVDTAAALEDLRRRP